MSRFSFFILGLGIGFILSIIAILALAYYAKGDWIEFRLIFLEIGDLAYKITYVYFKYVLFVIAIIVGITAAYVVYEITDVGKKKEQIEEEIEQEKKKAEKMAKEAERARIEAHFLRSKTELEAEEIKRKAYDEGYRDGYDFGLDVGYEEGKERAKQELKTLRRTQAAIKNIFKNHTELDETFKKKIGFNFETWLKKLKKK